MAFAYTNMKKEGSKFIGFGKYYGRTFEEIYTFDYSYCMWVTSVTAYTFSMYDFQNYIHKMNTLG